MTIIGTVVSANDTISRFRCRRARNGPRSGDQRLTAKKMNKSAAFLIKGSRTPLIISVLIAILAGGDLAWDLVSGITFGHVFFMAVLTAAATVGAVHFSNNLRVAWREERDRRRGLEKDYAKASQWHQEEEDLLRNLNKAINRQFDRWEFSPTEKDVALHLLKGLSLKDIAHLRGSTDGTVKQQAHVLYHKAGLKGRAELSAHFLGGLLPEDLTQENSGGAPETQIGS